jgi:hypothetical protein
MSIRLSSDHFTINSNYPYIRLSRADFENLSFKLESGGCIFRDTDHIECQDLSNLPSIEYLIETKDILKPVTLVFYPSDYLERVSGEENFYKLLIERFGNWNGNYIPLHALKLFAVHFDRNGNQIGFCDSK